MQTLEVSHLRRIAGFDQRFETGFDQRGQAAAKHGLFAEQICFGLFAKICLDNSRPPAANGRSVREPYRFRGAGRILMNSEQARHTRAALVFAPHQMPRPFRRHHENIHVIGRFDKPVMNREAVREREIFSRRH